MLSRIIERSSDQSGAHALPLQRVNNVPARMESTNNPPEPSSLMTRIAQLEQALAETEAAAYARGRHEAETEARERYSAVIENAAKTLARSVGQLADIRPRLCKEAEADVLRLALAIAQRILHRALTIDATALEALVNVSLDRLGRQEQIRVRVNPSLADPVRAILAQNSSRPIEVCGDTHLEAGSLIFETSRGQLDASIRSQLDEIERGLIDRLENRS